jgi:fatty-acyl-CoA synthase
MGPLAHWRAEPRVALIREPIGELLRGWAGRQPGATALLWERSTCIRSGTGVIRPDLERMSYAELLSASEALAHWLLEGSKPGDRIGLWARNSVEAVLLEYGCALAGSIFTPFNPAWTDYEVEHALALTTPRMLFAGLDSRGRALPERASRLARDCPVLDVAAARGLSPREPGSLPELTQASPFLIQFTSGTTGRAKGALLSHRAALNTGYVRPGCDGAGPDDVWLNPVPIHHIGGSCAVVLGALSVGGACVVLEKHDPEQIARLAEPVRATRMGGVPTIFLDLLDSPTFPKERVPIRAVTLGGAAVPPSLVRRVQNEWGASVAIGYGQSECGVVTGTRRSDDPETIATTVGRPLPDAEVKVVDRSSGETLRFGEIGEICVRSGTAMDGYFGMPEATAEVFDSEGFLHTGDLGSMDDQGLVRIVGRAREVIIRGGENIYPAEVEDALLQHPAVAMTGVIGVDDARLGQDVAAFVQLRPGKAASAEELEAFVRERIAHFKVPKHWRFMDSLPMTASGKVRKIDLSREIS